MPHANTAQARTQRAERRTAGPLRAEQLDAVLHVIEAAQSLAAGDDVAEMLAALARELTELLGASGCMVSIYDRERGLVRDRAGYARPPHSWPRTAIEYRLEDYPATERVLRTGEPYTCCVDFGNPDPSEVEALAEWGYRSLLMVALPVDGEPYALIELYDARSRIFSRSEIRLCQALASEAGAMVSRARMAERLEDAYFATLGTLAAALEAKDAYTNDHANEIAELAGAVCEQIGIPPREARIVRLGALLHDIGKIGISESVLRKPAPLDEEERRAMQQHTVIGARILEPVPYFAELVPLVRSSHERYDGTGYPDGLAGEKIPLGSRIIAVCDAFHAMTEDRVYRRALPLADALAEVERCAGTQFDPVCAHALIAVVRAQGSAHIARDQFVRLAGDPA
jgi:putative nucleotidyltransferase with HDIG domain